MKNKKIFIIALIIIAIDITSKLLISNSMLEEESINIIPNFFSIKYEKNTGVAFSLLEGSRIPIIIITILIIVVVFKYIYNKRIIPQEQLAISLILGGAIGNLIDRIIYGYVIDFLDFKLGNYNYPIFNIADSAIVIGVIIYIIINIKNESR